MTPARQAPDRQRPDTDLERTILAGLQRDVRLAGAEVAVRVQGGRVIMEGVVESWTLRMTVHASVQRLANGASIQNHVRVQLPGAARRDDGDVHGAVLETLRWHALIPELPIVTSVSSGRVALRGAVASASQRRDAEQAVKCLSNVRAVTNELEVTPGAFDEDAPAPRRPPAARTGTLAARECY